MSMANTVKCDNGAEVYENKILYYADEYINDLKSDQGYDDDEIKALMRRSQPFKGMLKYIYINIFKPDKDTKTYNNIKQNSNIDYSDIDLLNCLWDIYTSLCYKYLQCPTLLNFSLFSGIRHETLTDWTTGNTRANGDAANSPHCQSAKKWLRECEASAYDSALCGNPGAMFILKSNYGYTETPQRIEVVGQGLPQESAAEIAARHAGAELPELPDLD